MNIHRPIAGGVMTIDNAHNKALQLTARCVLLNSLIVRGLEC
jgi:hypothetical protein